MKIRISTGLAVGLVLPALLAAPALAGPTVTIRVEGATHTLLERTRVTLPDTPPPVTGGCPANSPGNALEVATAGNWDRQAFTQTVLGESHTFADNDYWAEWLNTGSGYKYGGGICSDTVKTGDDVVMLVDVSDPNTFLPTVFPLAVEGVPAKVRTGTAFTVTVVEYRAPTGTPGEGVRTPVAGATVRAGAVTATTASDGRA